MSSTIWTRCAGAEQLAPLELTAHRMVEAQHRVSTLKLVDTPEEQALLEEMIEGAKPPRPDEAAFDHLHYLLATPFRYPPLRHGSRFGPRGERGLWYGSREATTAMTEVAYYRQLFLADSEARIPYLTTEHSLFRVRIETEAGIDLLRPPFLAHEHELRDPTSYAATQPLGSAMREAGVEAFLFLSARAPDNAANLAVFTPRAFARKTPQGDLETWHCLATRDLVIFRRRRLVETTFSVPARQFQKDGRLLRVTP